MWENKKGKKRFHEACEWAAERTIAYQDQLQLHLTLEYLFKANPFFKSHQNRPNISMSNIIPIFLPLKFYV